MKRLFALTFALLLAACGDDRPPAPTAEESARLDEAEAMLNDMGQTKEGPGDRSPGHPSNH